MNCKTKRKICVVTGSRADSGLLMNLLRLLNSDDEIELQLIPTAAHLSPEFGLTYKELENNHLPIIKRPEILLSGDSPAAICKTIALGLIDFGTIIGELAPEIVVLLGDRYELLSVAIPCLIHNTVIAHIHGGEKTEGAIDDAIRHSLTKMSHLHFTSTEEYRTRVIQLGEDPRNVFNVGAPGLDAVFNTEFIDRERLISILNIKFNEVNFLVTYHPVTIGNRDSKSDFIQILEALYSFKNANIFFTKGNADTNGRIINILIDKFVKSNPERAFQFENLGQAKYFSLAKQVDAVIGNSSSGIIEIPSLGTPTVNIGDRQKGRIRPRNVIQSSNEKNEIILSIEKAIKLKRIFLQGDDSNPYGKGETSKMIYRILKNTDLSSLVKKEFYDLNKII